MTAKKNYYLRPTGQFCIAGLLIPGFTAVALVGVQMAIVKSGVECVQAWPVLWTITWFGMLITPMVFIAFLLHRFRQGFYLSTKALLIFNLLEYTFIQSSLASMISNPRTLCYVSDGQNGIEFIFTGWMALPFLALLSLLFDKLIERKIDEAETENPIPPDPVILAKGKRIFMLLIGFLVIIGALTIFYGYHWWDVLNRKGNETIYYAFFLLITSILFQVVVWKTTQEWNWFPVILGTLVNFIFSFFIGVIIVRISGLRGISREMIFVYSTCYLIFFTISVMWQRRRMTE